MLEECCENFLDPSLHEIEVDQRALMNNILSRYPGTFDVLRELIQNADDADAHNVELHFLPSSEAETSGFASTAFDVSKVNVCQWIIKNDGNTFTLKDWDRLGRIADGNDDSTKVGAFGVGFYSVLSKSDRPLMTSNGEALQFFRGDDGQLRKKFFVCRPADRWTTVELELRVPEPLPVLADLARFLVSSVAFLANIKSISIYIKGKYDRRRLMCIKKESIKSTDDVLHVPMPPHLVCTTVSQILTIESIHRIVQKITIDAEDWVFTSSSTSSSSLVDAPDTVPERPGPFASGDDHPTGTSQDSHTILDENVIMHDLYAATVRVNLPSDSEMSRGVESSMKSLPSSFECKALYFNSQQYESLTSPKAKRLAHIVSGPQGIFPEGNRHVLPVQVVTVADIPLYELTSGRLFIGQSTNQTTGIELHLSGHFLSTVERGSIDLANGQVAAWNKDVLWICGCLARIIYEEEMGSAKAKDSLATQVGLYTMNRFAFGSASPHSGVSQILEDAFFSCCCHQKTPFPVVSDIGISCLSNSQFRKSHKDLSFVQRFRVLHEKVEPRQLSEIIKRYNIPLFQYGDILQEFEAGVLPETLRAFFEWWEGTRKSTPPTKSAKVARKKFCKAFPSRGVLRSTHGPQVIALKNIKYFTFLPLPDDLSPPDTIYIEVRSGLPSKANVECFGWSQLPLLHWLKFACTGTRQQENSRRDLDVGYRVLRVLVQFALIEEPSEEHWNQVAELMRSLECIPTTVGRRDLPENSYFEEANIVGDLPVVDEAIFLDIPTTPVAVEKGFEHRPVGPEHVRNVLARIRVHAVMHREDLVGKYSDDLLEVELPPTTLAADNLFNYDEAPASASSVCHEDQVPPLVSSHSTSQPPVHPMTSAPEIHLETPETCSEKHNDSAPPSRFFLIFQRWKKRTREPAVPEARRLADIQSRSVDNVNASKRAFSTMAKAQAIPRTVRRIVEKKKKQKKSKARPRADDRESGTNTGGRPPNPGPSSDVALPSDVDGDHGGGTSTGRPLDPKPASEEVQQAMDAGQPSNWRIGLREEPGKVTFSFTIPTWLCCRSSGTEEE